MVSKLMILVTLFCVFGGGFPLICAECTYLGTTLPEQCAESVQIFNPPFHCRSFQDKDTPGYGEQTPSASIMLGESAERIIAILTGKDVRFEDLKDTCYKNRGLFCEDILQAMHKGADIRQTKPGYYRYHGQLKEVHQPSEDVSIAMFNILKERVITLFDLKFCLYLQGYRSYTPAYLNHLEGALVVGNVHPYRSKINAHDFRSFDTLQEIWRMRQEDTHEHFCSYMNNPGSCTHATVLSIRRNKRILIRLKDLYDREILPELEILHAAYSQGAGVDKNDHKEDCTPRENRKSKIMQVLRNNQNTEISLRYLLRESGLPQEGQGKTMLLGVVTSLALRDVPIVYDKDAASVTLLSQVIAQKTPKPNTNLLTMVYDLTSCYQEGINLDEMAYYAYREGYWPEGFGRGQKKIFCNCVNDYRKFLAILGYIDACCCEPKQRGRISCQRDIWKIVRGAGGVRDIEHYRSSCPNIIESDLDVMRALYTFYQGEEFLCFCFYFGEQNMRKRDELNKRLQCVEERVRAGPATVLDLQIFYNESFGLDDSQSMWDIAGILTNRKSGRLIYDPQRAMFSWDNDSCVPTPSENTLVAEVFSLINIDRDMPEEVLGHMLKQKGFQDVDEEDVQKIKIGLSVLGLRSGRGVCGAQVRKAINAILDPGCNPDGVLSEVADRVVCWVHSGSFLKLWRAYKETLEVPPPVKRKKPGACRRSPENIIHSEIPALYAILQKEL